MNDDLLFRRNALSKRRAELLQQIANDADEISRIDKDLQAEHAFDGVDIDNEIR